PYDDLAADGDRALLDLVQAEDADLRRGQDGGAEQRGEDAAVSDREGAAPDLLERQRAIFRTLREVLDRRFDLPERHAIGIAQHGDDQARARADSDPDVEIALQHHLVALDLGVDAREPLERS